MAIWGPILILRHTPLQLIHGWTWMNNLYRIILDATYQKHMAVENHVQALFDGWVRKICWFEKHPETNPQPHYYAHLCWWISYTKDSLSGHSQLPGSSTDIDWVPWEQGWLVPQRSESQQVNTCWSHAICISQLEHTSKIDRTIWYEYIYIWLHMYTWIHSTKHPSWFDVSISLSPGNKGTISNKLHLTYGKQKQKDAQRCKCRKWRVIVHLHVWIKNTHWTNWGLMTWHFES